MGGEGLVTVMSCVGETLVWLSKTEFKPLHGAADSRIKCLRSFYDLGTQLAALYVRVLLYVRVAMDMD